MRIEPKSEFNLFVVPSLDRQDRFGTNFGYRNFIWALVIALDYRNDIGLFAPGRRVATSKGLGSPYLRQAFYQAAFAAWRHYLKSAFSLG